MRLNIKDILLLVFMVGAGFLARWQWSELAKRMDRVAESQQTFARGAREAIATHEHDDYLGRIQSLLRVYKRDVSEIRSGNIGWPDGREKKLERQLEHGAIDEAQYETQTEVLALAKRSYETLLNARWRSQLTGVGKGATRLDIFRIQQRTETGQTAGLEADFFLWGVAPDTRVTWGRTEVRYWRPRASSDRTTGDPTPNDSPADSESEASLVMIRHDGVARPSVFVKQPTSIVRQFPTFVAIGTFRLPSIPQSASQMDLELEYSVQKDGNDEVTRLAWTRMPIPTEWRREDGAQTMTDRPALE